MKVCVIGATGYIGNAVARAFRISGHTVTGFIRSPENSARLLQSEIRPLIGDLKKLTDVRDALLECEVIVYCAQENTPDKVQREAATLNTLLDWLKVEIRPKTFLYTSGVWLYGNTNNKIVDESSSLQPIDIVKWRPQHEELVLQNASSTLKTVVIRPGCVYGLAGGLTSDWFSMAAHDACTIIGEGSQRWSMVHIDDLASGYVLSAEKELNRTVLNFTNSAHHTVKEMVTAVATLAQCQNPLSSISVEEGFKRFGPLVSGLLIDQKISSARAYRLLGWQPKHPSFLDGIADYFASWKAHQT